MPDYKIEVDGENIFSPEKDGYFCTMGTVALEIIMTIYDCLDAAASHDGYRDLGPSAATAYAHELDAEALEKALEPILPRLVLQKETIPQLLDAAKKRKNITIEKLKGF